MTSLPIHRVATVAAIAIIASACVSTAGDTTTTSAAVAPSTTTTSKTLVETTTTAPLQKVVVGAVGEGIPEELLVALGETLSWRVDQRNAIPPIPESFAGPLLELDLDTPDILVVTTKVAELTGGSVAILAAASGDVYAAADEGSGWQIVGADAAKGGAWFGGEPRLVLVLGSDARPGQNQQRYRADSVHLLTARASDGTGTILGFPRDSYVPSPFGSMKLSSVMSGRGPEVITDVVAVEWDLPIEGYVVTGFKGFEGLMGNLGNLPIDLPRSIPEQPWWPAFRAGTQTLSPQRVLEYSRTRKGVPGGDFTRSGNQGVVMLAILRLIQTSDVLAAPTFLTILEDHAWTDLSPTAQIQLAATAFTLDPDQVENVVLPGTLGTAGGGSVVFLGDDADAMIADFADDGLLNR